MAGRPWIGTKTYRTVRTIHKWAGLAACVWLFVLAVTGILLDHHEWRWLSQVSVPESWTSERINGLVPGTVMRHIAIDAADPNRLLGASERGMWLSEDRGATWTDVAFEGLSGAPMVHRFVGTEGGRLEGLFVATDDGIWRTTTGGSKLVRLALKGKDVTGLSQGHGPGELVGVIAQGSLVRVAVETGTVTPVDARARVAGLSATVPAYRFVMDLHFGRGTLPGSWSIWINDLGGVAMAVLAVTGLAYWWTTRRSRRRALKLKFRRRLMRWLYRFHAPVLGLAGAIPILYLSVTAIPMNHIFEFIPWARGTDLARSSLPPVYRLTSFGHEIRGVAAWPGEPERLSLSTRFGVIESRDGGASWAVDRSVPVPPGTGGANLFRVGDRVFAAFGGGRNFWRRAGEEGWSKIDGPSRALTSAAVAGETWYVKNSRSIFSGPLEARAPELADTEIPSRHAAPGTTFFLFVADIHTGLIFFPGFGWVNDVFAALAIFLVVTGPIAWARTRWM